MGFSNFKTQAGKATKSLVYCELSVFHGLVDNLFPAAHTPVSACNHYQTSVLAGT